MPRDGSPAKDEVGQIQVPLGDSNSSNFHNLCTCLCDSVRGYLFVRGSDTFGVVILYSERAVINLDQESNQLSW